MNRFSIILIITFISLASCEPKQEKKKNTEIHKDPFIEIIAKDYELYKPKNNIKGVLLLFGGYPERVEDIIREFNILEIAKENNVAVILSNYNRKLWLSQKEKRELAQNLQDIIINNQLPTNNITIGGFSSGGTISLLISNFIVSMKEFYIDPKGVFIIDSPIDLSGVYSYSEKTIDRNFSEAAVQEGKYLLDLLNDNLGKPKVDIQEYEDKSIFTLSSNNISNIKKLKNTKIRLYTEPDSVWWKKNRNSNYEELNAYYIKELFASLKNQGFDKVEYIPTQNKGYKANGDRHPHSWSIIDKQELIDWMLENE